jgi:crotonobetaine/carnitine-CoA ligase
MRRTIPDLLRLAVDEVPDKAWLVSDELQLTYAEALEQVQRGANALRSAGIGRADRVLVTARNTADYVLAWLALMDVGAIQVPLNPKSTEDELAGFVRQVTPSLTITDASLATVVDAACAQADTQTAVLDISDLFDAEPDTRAPHAVKPEDVAVMIPTSGTTGRSKLVMQTHLAYVMAAEGFPFWLELTPDDRLMTSLPLFHINAPAYSILGSLAARASVAVLPAFSAIGFIDDARRFGATEFNSIGAMLEILMRQPERADDADNPLRLCYTGPSPDEDRQKQIERRFGFEIKCGYALSESPYGLVWRRGTRPYGTLGSPRQHPELGEINEARVLDGDRFADVGEIGELELRNPVIMRGYYEMPEETEAARHDGWLRTGDLVQVNGDGTYTFIGRTKEVIRRRGENLSPVEVEAALERHPGVAEAAVIGVPSDLSEEDVKTFVVASPDGGLDLADLHEFARTHLAAFKVPRYIEIVLELPHTPTGRLAKHQLDPDRNNDEVDFEASLGQSR